MMKARSLPGLATLVLLASFPSFPLAAATDTGAAIGPQETRVLRLREVVEREIGSDETHAYTLEVDAHHFVLLAVEQRGADVQTRVLDPSGRLLETFDSPGGRYGGDPVAVTTAQAGTYRFEVSRAGGNETEEPRYALSLQRLEPVSASPQGRVDQLLSAWDRPGEPGLVAAVVSGGEVVYVRALGQASLEHDLPNTPYTVFDIGSVSKELTDFAMVLLAQEDHLSLDDDIRTHLPEVPDFGTPIRIRHLIHHTSGLREIYDAFSLAGSRSGDALLQEDALRLVTHLEELNFQPGSDYLYCNTGYMLLADIVARVTDRPFPEWMDENVFEPLGMANTTIMAKQGQVIPRAAYSYGPDGQGGWIQIFDNSTVQGAGGVYTTVTDLARWIGNFSEPRLGGPEAILQMQERGVLTTGDTLDYAFGLRIDEHRGLRRIGHTGSSAGYRTSLAYYPEVDVGIVVVSNYASRDPSVGNRLAEAYLATEMGPEEGGQEEAEEEEREEEEEEGEAWSPTSRELEAYAGRYVSPELETIYTLSVEDETLMGRHFRHGSFRLRPHAPDEFRGPGSFARIRFHRDGEGRVTGLRVSNGRVRDLWFEKRESSPRVPGS
jgi:CubicO group peptidase (beta-lactamase class C family)